MLQRREKNKKQRQKDKIILFCFECEPNSFRFWIKAKKYYINWKKRCILFRIYKNGSLFLISRPKEIKCFGTVWSLALTLTEEEIIRDSLTIWSEYLMFSNFLRKLEAMCVGGGGVGWIRLGKGAAIQPEDPSPFPGMHTAEQIWLPQDVLWPLCML